MNLTKTILTILFFLFSFSNIYSQPWIDETSGVTEELTSVSAPDNYDVWVCGFNKTILRTTNAGNNWTVIPGAGITSFLSLYTIFGISSTTALVSGSTGTATFVYRTSDSGVSWTQVFTQTNGFINAIRMRDVNNGFMMGDPVNGNWSLWRTSNGGLTWTPAEALSALSNTYGTNNCLSMIGTNIWFGTTNHTLIYHSTNNGTNWSGQNSPNISDIRGIAFNNLNTGVAGTNGLVKTTNSGVNWLPVTGPNILAITGDMNNSFWAVGSGIINKSTDNGNTWSVDHTLTGSAYRAITYSRSGTASASIWAVGTHGSISYFGQISGITPINNTVVTEYKLAQNFPNPFNPETKINFAIPHSGFTALKVYTIDGKEVATLVNENLSQGNYSITFSNNYLSSGIYFYTLTSGNYSETKKMILVK
ncbi:hypothetical protein BH10BAC5_BH10BAC5_21300 [soil metagenome]